MSLARSSTQYMGVRAILPPDLIIATRAPNSSDKAYVKGTLWLNTAASTAWMWPGSGNWIALGSGTTGAIVTITGGSGGALSPVAGNINIVGTANQITSIGSGSTITLSLPVTLVVPGALTSVTSIAAGTTVTAGTGIVATTGNITASNGNIVRGTAGNKDVYSSVATTTAAGANSAGTVTLVGGTATISTTSVTATSKIRLTRQSVGATGANPLGSLSVGTITASTSFVINAWSSASATALATTDVSSIFWEIVN